MTRALFFLCVLLPAIAPQIAGQTPGGQQAATVPAATEHARLADSIRAVEGWRGRDGAAGERGPYQLTAAVWALHNPGRPFALARQEGPARACALKHLAWLSLELGRKGVDPSAFNVAAAWNAGLEGYTTGRAPVRAYLYARDVERIYTGKYLFP